MGAVSITISPTGDPALPFEIGSDLVPGVIQAKSAERALEIANEMADMLRELNHTVEIAKA